jgi:hypothetical protein
MAHDARSGPVQMWGPPLVSAALSLVVLAIAGWFTLGQRLTSVETGLAGLREIVDARFADNDRRFESIAAHIRAQLDENRADVREIRKILMEQRAPAQPSGVDQSGMGKRRR